MTTGKLSRRSHDLNRGGANTSRPPPPPPPPPFSKPVKTESPTNATTLSTSQQRRVKSRDLSPPPITVLDRMNCEANAFAPPPLSAPIPVTATGSSRRRNPPPPPPPRKSNANVTPPSQAVPANLLAGQHAHQIIRLALQKPMGIVFGPNNDQRYGVRIIGLPQQGAAAMTQQLCVGDALISVNHLDCSMWNSKEVLAFIGQAEGNIEMDFRRQTTLPAPAPMPMPVVAPLSTTPQPMEIQMMSSNDSLYQIPVVNLKWTDISSGQSGRYSGMVNQHKRPNGHGRFTSDQGHSLEGQWQNGAFLGITPSPSAVNDAAMMKHHANASDAATLTTFNRRSSATSLHSHTHEGMSYATSQQSSSFSLSDYPNLYQQPPQQHQQQFHHQQQPQPQLQLQQPQLQLQQTSNHNNNNNNNNNNSSTPIHYYCLGETIRSPQHMIHHPSVEHTIQSIYALRISDFVFIQRSSGDWSFCQLIERKANEEGEEVMTFVVNEVGHRKSLRPSRWVKMLRSCSIGVTIRPGDGGGAELELEF